MKHTLRQNWTLPKAVLVLLVLGVMFPKTGSAAILPPVITTQPASQTALGQGPATFQVVATSSGPLTYQWYKNGTSISGATTNTYTIPSVQLTNQASYSVRLTNAGGWATSSIATLTVISSAITANSVSASTATSASASLTWPHTVNSGNNRALFVGLSIDKAATATSVKYGGLSMTLEGRAINGSQGTVELWSLVAPPVGTTNIVATISSSQKAVGGATTLNGVDQTTPTSGSFQGAVAKGTTATLPVPSAPRELVIGVLWGKEGVTATEGGGQSRQWSFATGSSGGNPRGAGCIKAGAALVTNSWTLSSSVQWAVGGTSIKPANLAPVANGQSVSTAEDTAKAITLTGSDVENSPLTFSLVTGPANGGLSGLNTSNGTLTYTPNTNFNGADSFTFRVNDGTTNSTVATVSITVTPVAPKITAQPQSRTNAAGQSASFSVTAASTMPLGYQWNRNGSPLFGATNSTLVLNPVQPTNAGNYTVVVTNVAGSMTSAVATLTVTNPPSSLSVSGTAGLTGGGFAFQLSVPAGGTYVVLASTDLKNWNPIATNVALTGSVVFTDPAASQNSKCFYRAQVQ